jgi:hypothetical protein
MLLNTWNVLNSWQEPVDAGDEEPTPSDLIGGAHAGYSGRRQRKKDRAVRDDQEFLEILAIAIPEIIKYLK